MNPDINNHNPFNPTEPVAPTASQPGYQPAPTPTPTPAPAPTAMPITPAAAPKKFPSLILIIIAAVLLLGGGITAAVIIANANGGKSGQPGSANQNSAAKPYENDDNYYVIIRGKKYTINNKLSDLSASGYAVNERYADRTVKPGDWSILGSAFANEKLSSSISAFGYNDTDKELNIADCKLGKVEIGHSISDSADKEYMSMEFYGGLHLDSSREDVIKVFGEPTSDTHQDTFRSSEGTEVLRYQVSTLKFFQFQIDDGKVAVIGWTNVGELSR